MRRNMTVALFAMLLAVGGLGRTAWAGTVTVMSGVDNGSSRDANVSFWLGGNEGPLSSLDSSTFSSARSGEAAYIVSKNRGWSDPPTADSAWISQASSSSTTTYSALFAVPFSLTDTTSPIALDVSFLFDNGLGDSQQAGLYIDGNGLSGSTWIPTVKGDYFKNTQTYHSDDIRSLLGSGTDHYLYFYVLNKANSGDPNPSGLAFSATFTPTAVPLPDAAWMGLVLLAALGVVSWRRRRRFRRAM